MLKHIRLGYVARGVFSMGRIWINLDIALVSSGVQCGVGIGIFEAEMLILEVRCLYCH